MKLHIDSEPKIERLKFATLQLNYSETQSPRSIITQSGLEFDHFRVYQSTDDAKLIDWIASARTNDLVVRVFTEDISMNVLILVDVSASMIYGTGKKAKIEFAVELAINLAFGILNFGDNVGVAVYSTTMVNFVPFVHSDTGFAAIKEILLDTKKFGGGLDFRKSLSLAIEYYKSTHMVIIISDFLGYGPTLFDNINAVSDRFDILAMMVNDRSDVELPENAPILGIQDPYSDKTQFVNSEALHKAYYEENMKRIENLKSFFAILGKEMWVFNTDDDIPKKVPELLLKRNFLGGFE